MSIQKYFKDKFYDLVLKKNLSVTLNQTDCQLELMDEGKTLCLHALLYETGKGFSESFLLGVEGLEDKGLLIDSKMGQILIARKHYFDEMTPEYFSLRLAQFFSEIQKYRKEIDGFKGKEYAFIRKS